MKVLVTLSGECFDAEYIDARHTDGQDGTLFYFKLQDLVKDRGLRNVSLFLSGMDRIFVEDYDARIETVRLNALRRAFDLGTFSFDTPAIPDRYYELHLTATDFHPQKKASDEVIRRFIKVGAYWLGFKLCPEGPNPFVDFDCVEDFEYLGARSQDIRRNVRFLTEEGYLRPSSAATFGNPLRGSPTSKLIREFQARNKFGSPPFAKKETVKHSDSVSSTPLKSQGTVLSKQEREKGQAWVQQEINKVAHERGVKLIEPAEWEADFDRDAYWVRIATSDGQEKLWKFSYEQLEDLVNDKRVRRELEKAIAFVVPEGPEQHTLSKIHSALEGHRQTPAKVSGLDRVAIEPKRLLRVFLCHSKVDKVAVRRLYQRLVADGIDPWFDEEDLIPGQDWEATIKRAVQKSDVVIVCLSNTSVARRGFAQKEIRFALDVADEQPDGTIYLIPLKLEECEIPDRLKRWHGVELYRSSGYQKLLTALLSRSVNVGIQFPAT